MRMKCAMMMIMVMLMSLAPGVLSAEEWRDESRHNPRYFAGKNTDIATHGYEWVAASAVLANDGVMELSGINWRLREGLDWQLQKGAVADGLKDGEVPATDEGCAPHRLHRGFYAQEEHDGRFSSALLLSQVAVAAKLETATPGFLQNGNPGVMFSLTDVVPLHARSDLVDHVLVPFDRLVIGSRVFCAVTPSESLWSGKNHPKVGDLVVVMGKHERGVVSIGTWWTSLGYLAVVGHDGEALYWDSAMWDRVGRPGSPGALRLRVDEAVSGSLFNLTTHLVHLDYGSTERVQFVEMLRTHESNGCRVNDAVVSPDDEKWIPGRIVCPPRKWRK